jgi:hypothetical protein
MIHFLNEYSITGRVGDKIRIKGKFPGIKQEEFIYLNGETANEDNNAYRIEEIEYNHTGENAFNAVIRAEDFGLV